MCILAKRVRQARAKGIPLLRVTTSDQPAAEVIVVTVADAEKIAAVGWNRATGWSGLNRAGVEACASMLGDASPMSALDPVEALPMLERAPCAQVDENGIAIGGTIAVLLAGDRVFSDPISAVCVLRLRTFLEANKITVIALGGAGLNPAPEIGSDAWTVDDPTPDSEARGAQIDAICLDNSVTIPADDRAVAIRYTRGLSAFGLRQAIAPCLREASINRELLRSTWRAAIDATPGLSVQSDGEGMAGVAGLTELRAFAGELFAGETHPDAIVWVDEIEKSLAGSTGDTSGSSQSVLGTILKEMESSQAEGILLVGPPGTGKSLTACAMGACGGVPTIQLDLGLLKGSLVGQTEAQSAQAMRVLRGLAGKAYWVATSNGLTSIPPELRRRFTDGIWMVDLPGRDERATMWALYARKYQLTGDRGVAPTDDRFYTGSDIRNVCRSAWRTRRTVREIAAGYVPSTLAAREQIDALRRQASGAYRSASYPGPYRIPEQEAAPSLATGGRKVQIDTAPTAARKARV